MKATSTLWPLAAIVAGALLLKKRGAVSGIGATHGGEKARLLSYEFRGVSTNGNPSYWLNLMTADGRFLRGYTAANSHLGYMLDSTHYQLEAKDHWYWYTKRKGGNLVFNSVE